MITYIKYNGIKYLIPHLIERFKDWYVFVFDNPYDLNMPYGNAPVQSEGNLNSGMYYYFRSRGASWSLEVAPTEAMLYSRDNIFKYGHRDWYEWPEGGMISKREAIRLATIGINRYYEEQKTKN
jgi:hypothetical protein